MYIFCVKPGSGARSLHMSKVDRVPESVAELRLTAAEVTGMVADKFNLVHCGRIVEDDKGLEFYKIGPKSCVHVLPRPPSTTAPVLIPESASSEDSDAAWTQFMISFGMAARNPSFSKFAKRLAKRENLENLAAAVPGLDADPIACAYLSKPDLLMSLLQPETFKYIRAKHPGLVEAATHLAAAIHEEKNSKPGGGDEEGGSNPFSYHLDEMSDDDDYDEMDMSPANQAGAAQQRGGHVQPISAEQLRAALSAAQSTAGIFGGTSGMGPGMGPVTPSSAGPSGSQPASGGAITQDQLAAALAAASASASGTASGNPFVFPSASQTPEQPRSEPTWEAELTKMKEMGITDEGLAKKALEIMGGDLQAAIELIFSGWDGMDESLN